MAEFELFSASTADLPETLLEQNNIRIIRMNYLVDGVDHIHTLREEDMIEFYGQIRRGSVVTTVQINIETFFEHWTPVLEQGKDILYLAFTSYLSGTYNSACLAAATLKEQYPQRKIVVIDSTCAALGEGILVLYAAALHRAGWQLDELAAHLEERKYHVHHWVTPEVLHYLRRGGRLSGASAFVGTLMDIKPIIYIDPDGRLVSKDKVRGRRRSIKYLFDRFLEYYIPGEYERVGIIHADCREEAQGLARMITESGKGVDDVIITTSGPIIGAHTGPGLIALFFFGSKRA